MIAFDCTEVGHCLMASFAQIVASDVGATLVGVDAADLLDFSYELVWMVAKGELHADKFAVAVKAAGLGEDTASLSDCLAEVLWYASFFELMSSKDQSGSQRQFKLEGS